MGLAFLLSAAMCCIGSENTTFTNSVVLGVTTLATSFVNLQGGECHFRSDPPLSVRRFGRSPMVIYVNFREGSEKRLIP